jgi:hypothetical protein
MNLPFGQDDMRCNTGTNRVHSGIISKNGMLQRTGAPCRQEANKPEQGRANSTAQCGKWQ